MLGRMRNASRLCAVTVAVLALALIASHGRADQAAPPPPAPPPAPMPDILKSYRAITTEHLKSPGAEDWLMVRRTYDGWGYSPLEQVTSTNVSRLQPVWVFSTGVLNGHEAPPIVNNGIMFVATPGNQVLALDAKAGRLLWRYTREVPETLIQLHRTSRGVALYGDKVFLASGEAALVALDARTGGRGLDDEGCGQPDRLLHVAGAAGC